MMEEKRKIEDRVFLAAGIAFAVSEIWKQLCLTFAVDKGSYDWFYFPFQLCSVPMYICLLIWIFRKTGFRQAGITFLSDFTLMSGIIVFLDTSGMHYGYAPLTVHSFVWHFAIALLGIYSGVINRKRTLCSFLPAAGIFISCCILAEVFNLAFDRYGPINMFYINPHYYMGQIVFSSMLKFLPNNAVILIYIISAMAGAFLVHLGWMLLDRTIFMKMPGYGGKNE